MAKEEASKHSIPFKIEREGPDKNLTMDYTKTAIYPSIEDNELCFGNVMDTLIEVGEMTNIILSEERNYVYPYDQTQILNELRRAYIKLVKEDEILKLPQAEHPIEEDVYSSAIVTLRLIILELFKRDPIGAYLTSLRTLRLKKIESEDEKDIHRKKALKDYVHRLTRIITELKATKLIKDSDKYLSGYKIGDRSIYRILFEPQIKPNFMYTRLMSNPPTNARETDMYKPEPDIDVTIYEITDSVKSVYHVRPLEFKLNDEEYSLLTKAREVLAKHKPRKEEFVDPKRMRDVFLNVAKDLLEQIAESRGIKISYERIEKLSEILVRLTVGFGLIEVLLADKQIENIYVNPPIGRVPVIVTHNKYGEMETNILPNINDARAWTSRFRMLSGRPLDESHPVLDTELILPNSRARVAIIQSPLSPVGYAYAFRQHRPKPWTLPLFMNQKMFSPLAAGLMWFLVDGARTMLVAGTRGSGKSSLLGSLLVQIMRKYRIITVEDSVTGDSEIIIKKEDKLARTTIGELVDERIRIKHYKEQSREISSNPEKIQTYSINKNGRIQLSEIGKFIRHKTNKKIYELTTRTGRTIKITGDHSIFKLGEHELLEEVKPTSLKEKDFIIVPRKLINNNKDKTEINLLEHLDKLTNTIVYGISFEKISLAKFEKQHQKQTINRWKREKYLPARIAQHYSKQIKAENATLKIRGSNKALPALLKITPELLLSLGLWLSDGCYDKKSIIFSSGEEECKKIIKKLAEQLNTQEKNHSDHHSLQINHALLKQVYQKIFGLEGNAKTKKFSNFIYSLSKEQIALVINGFFSGDGCVSDKELITYIQSKQLIKDLQTSLLFYGITSRVRNKPRKDGTIRLGVGTAEDLKIYEKEIGILQKRKKQKLKNLCARKSTHDSANVIPIPQKIRQELFQGTKNSHDYIKRNNNLGFKKLEKIVGTIKNPETKRYLQKILNSDIYFDQIETIKQTKPKGYVYDLSIPGNENFITNNILAHNTLELPVTALQELGYDIIPIKVRSAILGEQNELSAADGIRTTLRLGDSALIVGEVRSSLRGDEEVVIVEDGLTKRVPIKTLENKNTSSILVPTLDNEQKIVLKELTGFVKHPKRDKLLKITTKTGREVTVTPDHSVFTHVDFKIAAINSDHLKQGDPLIIPSNLPSGYNDITHLNLLEILEEDYRLENAEPLIRKAIKKIGWKKASKICGVDDIYRHLLTTQKTRIPITSFLELMNSTGTDYDPKDLRVKKGTSQSIPAVLPLNENVLRFFGYYLSEGNIDTNRIQITNSKPKIINDIINICKKEFGINTITRNVKGLGSSTQIHINCRPLRELLLHLDCGKTSYQKRIPSMIYGLNEKKIGALLKGMYSGDGSISLTKNAGTMIRYFSTSKKLVEDVAYALLCFGIVCRIHSRDSKIENRKKIYIAEIKQRKYVETFLEKIGFTHKNPQLLTKSFAHSMDDSVTFNPKTLEKHLKLPRKYRHLTKTGKCSKEYLKKITEEIRCSNESYDFAHGDFFVDKVKSIELITLKEPEFVYDLSVKSTQRFIGGFGGILLHNTEALALYEAMRVGALANVVAGTIHGDSPYGIFDRVVNDLGVPRTSFKATDIIVLANKLRSPDGLHEYRRITSITEVRKEWEEDPVLEHGFVNLMEYDSKKDEVVPTSELVEGESEVLKSIAGRVKEWAGNWDRVYENIETRAKIYEILLDYSNKLKRPEILEADFVIPVNDAFHKITEKLTKERGYAEPKHILSQYELWLKSKLKKEKNG